MFHETSLNCLMLCFCCCFLKRGRDRRLERRLSLINRLRTCNYLFSFHFLKRDFFCGWSKRLIPGSENRGIHISNRVWQRYSPHSKTTYAFRTILAQASYASRSSRLAYVFQTLQAQILCLSSSDNRSRNDISFYKR